VRAAAPLPYRVPLTARSGKLQSGSRVESFDHDAWTKYAPPPGGKKKATRPARPGTAPGGPRRPAGVGFGTSPRFGVPNMRMCDIPTQAACRTPQEAAVKGHQTTNIFSPSPSKARAGGGGGGGFMTASQQILVDTKSTTSSVQRVRARAA